MTRSSSRAAGAKGKADRTFSAWVRSIGFCERCGTGRNLQCAHIRSRRFSRWRVDPRNAVCLCAGCHHWFTDHPIEFASWVDSIDHLADNYAGIMLEDLEQWKQPADWWETRLETLDRLPARNAIRPAR